MKSPELMGSHQRCWIWGRLPVLETLRARRWPPRELHLDSQLPADELHHALRLAEESEIAVSIESSSVLESLCRSGEHQGYLAKMPPFPYDQEQVLLAGRSEVPFFVLLDAVQDPFNFGAILRSADAFGVDGVFISAANQVGVTSLVVRASAGAVNHVRLARIDEMAESIGRLQQAGLTVVGTSPTASRDISDVDFGRPVAVVLGNEAVGIRSEILALCDDRVSIRQFGHVGSLNAAVSAGIVFYEASRQRHQRGRSGRKGNG